MACRDARERDQPEQRWEVGPQTTEDRLAEKGGIIWASTHLRSLDLILQISQSPQGLRSWDDDPQL